MLEFKPLKNMGYGVCVTSSNANQFNDQDILSLKNAIYNEKIVVLKGQNLTPSEFVRLGRRFGALREYYEEMYHHREEKEIFVSSNIPENGTLQGVPKTGSFWHSDYAFMNKPFAITIVYPQIVPNVNRGTYFIDMAEVYQKLSVELKTKIENTKAQHSVRKYFKIRPKDIYQPIGAILKEIEERTPTVSHPTVITHPVTGEKILYISEGFTLSLRGLGKKSESNQTLMELLEFSGQLDKSFSHPFIKLLEIEKQDIILWDNRRLIHHAKHSSFSEPAKSYRVTVYDEFPFSKQRNVIKTKEIAL